LELQLVEFTQSEEWEVGVSWPPIWELVVRYSKGSEDVVRNRYQETVIQTEKTNTRISYSSIDACGFDLELFSESRCLLKLRL
jgi:hypothetical protein